LVVKYEQGIMAASVDECDFVCVHVNKGTCTHSWPSLLLVPPLVPRV